MNYAKGGEIMGYFQSIWFWLSILGLIFFILLFIEMRESLSEMKNTLKDIKLQLEEINDKTKKG